MRTNKILFIVYLIVSIWTINLAIGFVNLPDFLNFLNKFFLLAAGIMVLISGLKYLRTKRY